MNTIEFLDVSFTFPAVEGDTDAKGNQIVPKPVFDHFTGNIPGGFTSLIGPNGSGKSTFLLLASGRLIPQNGKVLLLNQDVAALPEEQKNILASVIYQNMEFETDDKVQDLLSFVYANGNLKAKAKSIKSGNSDLFSEVISVFELEKVLNHPLTEISKGEIQRTLLAFGILYGSASVFMDEPMFAMEDYQKNSSLEYLRLFCEETKTPVYISMHEIDLSRKYAQNVMLFYPDRNISLGSPEEVLTSADLEKAYGFPASMLKKHETMTREQIIQYSNLYKQ